MRVRENEGHQQYHHQPQHQNQALPRPLPLCLGFMGGYGLTDERTQTPPNIPSVVLPCGRTA